MKYFIALVTFFLTTSLYAINEVTYTTKHQPNRTVEISTVTSADSFVDIINADPKYLESLKAQGQRFPAIVKQIQKTKELITTKELDSNNNLPFTSIHTSHESYLLQNGQKIKIPSMKDNFLESTFYLTQLQDGTTKLNKISSNKLSPKEKKLLFQVFSNISKKNPLSSRVFKIGESFTDKTPITMPLGSINLNLIQNTKFTLREIKNNLAFFDIKATFEINVNMKEKVQKLNMSFNGFGEGEIIYNMIQKIETKNNFLMNFEANLQIQELYTMKMKSVVKMDVTQKIQPTKR